VHDGVARAAALPRLERARARAAAGGRRVRALARRGALAARRLSDLRLAAGDGAPRRRGARPPAPPRLRLLRDAPALPPRRVPLLGEGLASSLGRRDRGRRRPAARLVRGVPRLPEDLRGPGRPRAAARGLDLAPPRRGGARPRARAQGGVALRARRG